MRMKTAENCLARIEYNDAQQEELAAVLLQLVEVIKELALRVKEKK